MSSSRHKDPEYHKKWWAKNKHKYANRELKTKEISNRDYLNSKEKILNRQKQRRLANPEWAIWQSAKGSARRRGLEFKIVVEDIQIPNFCPVLKVPLMPLTDYAPSIDRVDNTKGYIKSNIQIISKKANIMKSNADKQELINFARWVLAQSI